MEKEKISKRKIQALETKKKIYEAAKGLFLAHGVEDVSVDSIVEAAGVSKGSFYVHFESKDSLASLLINDYVNEIDLDYKAYLEAIYDKVHTADILMLMTGKIAEVIANQIGCENMRILYKAHITKTINTNYAMSYDRDLYRIFTDILERGIRLEEFRADIGVEALAHHFVLAMRGITFEWCIRYPDFDLKEQYLKHIEILIRGIIR